MSHITLLELSQLIRRTLEYQLEPAYWVVAEIGELRQHQRGHCYLELVEKQREMLVTKQRATIWSSSYRGISQKFEDATGQRLGPGINILCQVQIQYHELYGLSLNIKDIDPNYTLGERARKRAEIIQRLIAEGHYDRNRQHTLAAVPQRIAVISSPTAAGWGDFMHQLLMNPYLYRFDLELFPASMQGDTAHESICEALSLIAANGHEYDAIVMIRGGGARIDLDCFDHYSVALAIANYPIPVLTGIGHDRDETIADLVAHTRLKTPTAVAEFLINSLRTFDNQVESLANIVFGYATDLLNDQQQHTRQLQQQLLHSTKTLVKGQQKQLREYSNAIGTNSRHRMRFGKERLRSLHRSVYMAADRAICDESSRLNQLAITLNLQDPQRLLRKGYTLTYIDGKPIHKSGPPQAGQLLITHAYNKIITSKVENSTTDLSAS